MGKSYGPPCILLLNFYYIAAINMCNGIAVPSYNRYLFSDTTWVCDEGTTSHIHVHCMYPYFKHFLATIFFGGTYLEIRKGIQMLVAMSICRSEKTDPLNHVDAMAIVFLFVSTIVMIIGSSIGIAVMKKR